MYIFKRRIQWQKDISWFQQFILERDFTGDFCVLKARKIIFGSVNLFKLVFMYFLTLLLLFLRVAILHWLFLFRFITLLCNCSCGLACSTIAGRLKFINSRHFSWWLAFCEGSLVITASCNKFTRTINQCIVERELMEGGTDFKSF